MSGYADNILLMALSVSGLNFMFNLVSTYSKNFNVKFNSFQIKLASYRYKDNLHNVIFEENNFVSEHCY